MNTLWLFVPELCCFKDLCWTTKISQKVRFSAVNSKENLIETEELSRFTCKEQITYKYVLEILFYLSKSLINPNKLQSWFQHRSIIGLYGCMFNMFKVLSTEDSTDLRKGVYYGTLMASSEIVYKRCFFGLLSTVDNYLIYVLNWIYHV